MSTDLKNHMHHRIRLVKTLFKYLSDHNLNDDFLIENGNIDLKKIDNVFLFFDLSNIEYIRIFWSFYKILKLKITSEPLKLP